MALEDFERNMARCVRCSLCKFPPLEQLKSWRFAKGRLIWAGFADEARSNWKIRPRQRFRKFGFFDR